MPTGNEKRIVFPENGRTPEYKDWLQRILDSGNCPFCQEHWPGEHKPPYEEKRFWILTENAVKSGKAQHHWLVICKRHVTSASDLSPEEFLELQAIYKGLIDDHKLDYLTFLMRSGNPHTGSTVAHLHAQVFVSKPGELQLTRV